MAWHRYITKDKISPRVALLLLSRFRRVRLCDSIDGSPPGSSIPGILQARVNLGGRKLQNPEGGSAQSTSMYIDCIAHCIPSKTRGTQNRLLCSLTSDSTFRMFTLLLTVVGNCTSPNTYALGRWSPSSWLPLTRTVF